MMKRVEVFVLFPGWDHSEHSIRRYPFIHLGGEKHHASALPKNRTQCPRPGLEPGPLAPKSSALTKRPPRLSRALL